VAGGKYKQDIETSGTKSKAHLGSRHVSALEGVQAWVEQIQLFSAAEHLDISNSGSMNSRLFGQFRGQAIQGPVNISSRSGICSQVLATQACIANSIN
jgi:hypothetical protein